MLKLTKDSNSEFGQSIGKIPNQKFIVQNSLEILNSLIDNKSFGTALEELDNLNSVSNIDSNLINSLQAVQIFSFALRGGHENKYWLNDDEVNHLLKNDTLLKAFIGLSIEVAKMKDYEGLYYEINQSYEKINDWTNVLSNF